MNIKSLLESKIKEYDASIDLTEGSRIHRTVITPVINSLSLDPLSVSTRDYLYARFSEAFPDSPITRGNALDDILITASEYFLDGYRAELASLKNATSLDNLDLLSDDEADALASNWFVSRDEGARATGAVTVVVDRPSSISIDTTSVRFFSGDNEYVPTVSTLVSTDALLANSVGSSLYEFTINVQAIASGSEFNVPEGAISRSTGISNVVSVINNTPILGGLGRDTTEYLLSNKLPRAISERSLVTARGIGARISTDIPGILRYQVIGHGDLEMLRDRVDVKSFSDLIASGHIYYMDSFALISAYPHKSRNLSSGDYLQTIGIAGAPNSLNIARVISTLNVSVLSNNPLGFTSLVELSEPPVEGVAADAVTVLRPGSVLLGETVVESDIGLGGRADIYIKGDTDQQIVGVSTLNLTDNSYRGQGWSMNGNVVTVELPAAIEENQFERYQHIVLNNIAYTISDVELDPNELRAYVSVYDADVTDSGTDYFIVDDLVYRTGADYRIVSPSNGSVANLSCIIGATVATLDGIDLATDGVRQGDVIEIPSLGIRRSIFSVTSSTSLSVDTAFQQTLSGVGARVIRFVSKVISPVSELDVPNVSPQHPISVDVEPIRAEIGVTSLGIGTILLPLGEAVADAMASADTQSIFADVYNTLHYYRVLAGGEDVEAPNRLAPASRGYRNETAEDLGQCTVLVAETTDPSGPRNDGRVENGVQELRTWCDLFTSNCNNIFVLRGDASTSSRILDFPGSNVSKGDILRINDGYLAGDYVIESVLHNILKRDGVHPTGVDMGQYTDHVGDFTYSDITDPNLPNTVEYQKVTFVRIYGEFPKNPLTALAAQLAVEVRGLRFSSGPNGVDPWTFGAISSSFINAYINGSADMFSPTASAQILDAFRNALSTAVLPPQAEDTVVDITSLFERGLTANYEIIKPSQSVGRVITRHKGDTTVLARPSAPLIDVDNLIEELHTGYVRAITHKKHTIITGSEGTYHLSPQEHYYIDGPDYTKWVSYLPPHIYDSRVAPDSYSETFADEYVLFDSLLEPSAGGILPLRIKGPSSITSPFLRNDGSRLIRYAERSLARNPLSLNVDRLSPGTFYLASPVFVEPEVMESRLCHVAPIDEDPAIVIQLYYIPIGTPEYDDVIDSLGDAVDGTGTPLSVIYREHSAFFQIMDGTAEALQFLVGLYGQLVVAKFLRAFNNPVLITDEFLLGSLLPGQGSILSLPELGCIPTSVATVSQRADRMEVVPSTELSSLESDLVGARLRIEYRSDVYWRRVSSTDGNHIYLNEPLPFGTPTCVASGICVLDLAENTASLISDPIFYGNESALEEWDEEYTTHLNTGGATRVLSDVDIGRHITFWGYRSNEVDFRSVLLDANLPEFDSFDSWVSGMMHAERQTFGQFEITDVSTTFSAISEGAETSPKRIDVSISSPLSATTPRIDELEPTKVLCAFAVTESVISLEDGLINSVAKVNVFTQEPYEYRFVGNSKISPDEYLVQPLFGAKAHSYHPVSDTTSLGEDVSTFVLTQDHSLEPTTIETDHLVVLSEDTDLVIRTTNARRYTAAQSMHASGERALGYTISPVDLGTSKSVDDDIEVRIPCMPGTISDTLAVQGYFDPTVGQAQSIVDATNERPVCADLLVKTLHQSYIGLEVTYVGGPSQEEVKQALTSFIKSRVLAEATITRSKIVSLIMNMGASTVNEPIDLYICLEDNSRRVHKRTIIDELSEATLFETDSTLRTIYPSIAVDSRLGASIVVNRISQQTNTVGNGGS